MALLSQSPELDFPVSPWSCVSRAEDAPGGASQEGPLGMNDLSVIIVTFRSSDVFPGLLDSLERQDLPAERFELIVVDNGSGAEPVGGVTERFPRSRLLENGENRGFAAAANQGSRLATGKYLLFLNPDTVLEKSCLRSGCRFLDANADVGVLGSRLISPNGNEQPSCWNAPSWKNLITETFLPHRLAEGMVTLRPNKTISVPAVSGACLFTRRDVFERVGGFDELFFMYYEDLDYCRRVEAEGYRVMHFHEPAAVHAIASSSHKNLDSFFTTIHRSRLFFYRKYLPLTSLVGPVIRVGLFLRIASYFLLGSFLPRFSGLARAHRLALQSLQQ